MAYASGTTVAAAKTQGEIMGLLGKRGVTKIATFSDDEKRVYSIAFEHDGVPYRCSLPLPDPSEPRFNQYKQGSSIFERTESAKAKLYEEEVNRKWRAFGMVIKAKIVAVEEGISTMQAEFIGNAILGNGLTVAETHAPELAQLAALGRLPALALPGGSGK